MLTIPKALSDMLASRKSLTPEGLEGIVKQIKSLQPVSIDMQGYYDRLQRGASWIAKAKRTDGDSEGKFIFLWIALNALYGVREDVVKSSWWTRGENFPPFLSKSDNEEKGPRELEWFLWRISGLDLGLGILTRSFEAHENDIEIILRTKYLMPHYWSWKLRTSEEIDDRIRASRKAIKLAVSPSGNREATYRALGEILVWRLRTLRNQLFHGCATDTHSRRRILGDSEIEAGSRLLEEFNLAFIKLMASEPGRNRFWPPCRYPRAGSSQHQPLDASWLPTK